MRLRELRNNREWRRRNPEKMAAHNAVQRALRAGTLTRPTHCERCSKTCKPEASHSDYQKKLEVEWLCRRCHVDKDFLGRVG